MLATADGKCGDMGMRGRQRLLGCFSAHFITAIGDETSTSTGLALFLRPSSHVGKVQPKGEVFLQKVKSIFLGGS
jgi:hypothetical protein